MMLGKCVLVGLFVMLICGVQNVKSQDCAEPCDLSLNVCNYVDYPVYTTGVDLAEKEAFAATIKPYLGFLSGPCLTHFSQFLCSTLYPKCDVTNNVTLPDGSEQINGTQLIPCKSSCEAVNRDCASIISLSFIPQSIKDFVRCDARFSDDENTCFNLTNLTPQDCGSNVVENGGYPGACTNYSQQVAPINYNLCSSFVSQEVYVSSAGMDLSVLDAGLNASTLWEIQLVYPLMSKNCYDAIVGLACQSAFPTCNRFNVTGVIVEVAEPLCSNMCEQANVYCKNFFNTAGIPPFDCENELDDFTGLRRWPDAPTYIAHQSPGHQNQSFTATCDSQSFIPPNAIAAYNTPPITKCPTLFKKRSKPTNDESPCWIPCPDPTYSNDEWDVLVYLGQAFGAVSFVLLFFLLCSYALDAQKRKFPSQLHMYQFISLMLFVISFFLNGKDGRSTWCNDEATYATAENNSKCAAQGFFFIFGSLATLAWWNILAFNIFLAVVFDVKVEKQKKFQVFYHLWGWGYPAVIVVASFANGYILYKPPVSWCLIHYALAKSDVAEHTSIFPVDVGLYYIPVGVLVGLTIIMLAAVVYKIVTITSRINETRSDRNKNASRAQNRLLRFVATLAMLFVLIVAWRISMNDDVAEKVISSGNEFMACKLKTELGIPDPGHCPGDRFPYRIDYGFNAFMTVVIASFGMATFACFGTDHGHYRLWKKVFVYIFKGDWDALRDLVVYAKDQQTSISQQTASTTIKSTSQNSNSNTNTSHKSSSSSSSNNSV